MVWRAGATAIRILRLRLPVSSAPRTALVPMTTGVAVDLLCPGRSGRNCPVSVWFAIYTRLLVGMAPCFQAVSRLGPTELCRFVDGSSQLGR